MPLSNVDYEIPRTNRADSKMAAAIEDAVKETVAAMPATTAAAQPLTAAPPAILAVQWNDSSEENQPPPMDPAPFPMRDFSVRLDAAKSNLGRPPQAAEEWPALLDQAITLLEGISQHPALGEFSAQKRRLDEIEQRLGYGAYPQ